jgi:hypothetical protein
MSTKAEIVKSSAALEALQSKLEQLKEKSEIAVTDPQTSIQAAQVRIDFESYIRSVEDYFEPELAPAEETVKRVRLQMSTLLTPVKGWLASLKTRVQAYNAEEKRLAAMEKEREQEKLRAAAREKAQAEQREAERLAKEQREAREKELAEQRKAGEINKREEARLAKQAAEEEATQKALAADQAKKTAADVPIIDVKPNIPTGAGLYKNQTYYSAEITNTAVFFTAYDASNGERRAFLRRFIEVNQQEVGKYARSEKNNKKVEADIPGCTASSRG